MGFVAGMLVHTPSGLVPIEQIKVGDLVLSKDGGEGKTAYKRVIKTIKSEIKQKIMSPLMRNYCSDSSLFWMVGEGWIAANKLYLGDSYAYMLVPSTPDPELRLYGRPMWLSGQGFVAAYELDQATKDGYWLQPSDPEYKDQGMNPKNHLLNNKDPFGIGGLYLIATGIKGLAVIWEPASTIFSKNDLSAYLIDFNDKDLRSIRTNQYGDDWYYHSYLGSDDGKPPFFKCLDEYDDRPVIAYYRNILLKTMSSQAMSAYSDYVYTLEVEDYDTYFITEFGYLVAGFGIVNKSRNQEAKKPASYKVAWLPSYQIKWLPSN